MEALLRGPWAVSSKPPPRPRERHRGTELVPPRARSECIPSLARPCVYPGARRCIRRRTRAQFLRRLPACERESERAVRGGERKAVRDRGPYLRAFVAPDAASRHEDAHLVQQERDAPAGARWTLTTGSTGVRGAASPAASCNRSAGCPASEAAAGKGPGAGGRVTHRVSLGADGHELICR
eukprot:scaffold168_cov410-Prasinococcus_capsulatus_cf.AAC.9